MDPSNGPCRGNRDQIAGKGAPDHIRFKMFGREIFNFCWPLLRIGPGLWNWGSNSTTSRSYNSLFAPNPAAAAPLIERSIPTTDRFLPGAIRPALVATWLPKIKFEQSRAQTTVAEIASRRGFKKSRPLF